MRDALIVWNDTIIDGHNRWRIIQKHPDLPFTVEERTFENRDEAILWMCNNQLGRRNLNDLQLENLTGRRYKAEKRLHGSTDFQGNQHTHNMQEKYAVSGQNVHSPKKTAEKIAEELGINEKSVRRAEKFVDGLDAAEKEAPGITQEILSGRLLATKKAVIAVGNEKDPEKRRELTESLLNPEAKESKPSTATERPELPETTCADEPPTDDAPTLNTDDVLVIIHNASLEFQAICEHYLIEFPELLDGKREQLYEAVNSIETFLKQIH